MKLYMFSVHDAKAEAYLPPFFVPSPPMAVRTFGNCANDPTHQFCMNAEDYTLFLIGEFDPISGKVEALSTPKPIGKALEFKRA